MGPGCLGDCLSFAAWTTWCTGLVLGRVRERTRALWQAFRRANSIGRMPACASTKSFGEVLSTPAEPEFLAWPADLVGGVYQTSIPYKTLGRATAKYSCLISLDFTPVDGLVSLLNCKIHLVALAVARCACSFHLSCESICIPKYL